LTLSIVRLPGAYGCWSGFGDDPVETRPLEALEPVARDGCVGRDLAEVDGVALRQPREGLLQPGPPVPEGQVEERDVTEGEQVEADELGGRLHGQLGDPRQRRVDPGGEVLPVQPLGSGRAGPHDDLRVDHTLLRQQPADVLDDLGEVPGQRLAPPARELDLVPVAHDEAAEAVPLRLVGQPAGDAVSSRHPVDGLGKHGPDREVEGLVHAAHCG